ncbi:tyrosine-type recombinase/integrase [Falsiruegeria mediterranea]|uniref:tyrosine-type recombinase/integrase n=1 Tax=Falsiruegeria mediterranea TaxID=1280832 RepID=UPI0015F287C3|nr:integrase arm-type DNA-binding domain-containing protein [Falsiruegeria mediterranea]
MAKKMKLSARNLAALEHGQLAWDTEVKGFGARKAKDDAVTLFLNYQVRETGKYRRVTIARLGECTVDAARTIAARMRLEIRAGVDVAQQAETPTARVASGETLGHHIQRWLDAPHSAWGKSTRTTYRRLMARDVLGTEVAGKRITDVSRGDLMQLVDTAARRTESGAILLAKVLRSFLSWADARGLTEVTLASNKRIDLSIEPRTRVMTDAEIVALWCTAPKLGERWGTAGRLVLLSGQRSGMITRMESDWVRQDGIHFPTEPNRKSAATWVPLTPWALTHLRPIMGGGGRLFSRSETFDSDALKKWRTIAEVDARLRLHDVRRSLRTWAARQGYGYDASEAALGHTVQRTALDKAYQQHSYAEEAAEVLRGWQRHIEGLVS